MFAFLNVVPSFRLPTSYGSQWSVMAQQRAPVRCAATSSAPLATAQAPSPSPSPSPQRVSRAVVWFREGDLRLQDHPGVEAACEHTSRALAHLLVCTAETPAETLAAAARLQRELQAHGSHLSVRFATDEASGVIEFLREFRAERVHVRLDVETDAWRVVERVERAMDDVSVVATWTADLREWDGLTAHQLAAVPDEYPAFLRWRPRAAAPVLASTREYDPQILVPSPGADIPTDSPDALDAVADRIRQASAVPHWSRQFPQRHQADIDFSHALELPADTPDFGEVLLRAYLERAEVSDLPDFGRTLGPIFRQGALSPRRMRQLVLDFERQHGRLFRFVFRDAAKQVLDFLDAQEFATLLARRDVQQRGTVDGEHEAKFWRWNGFLIRYVEEGGDSSGVANGMPPIVLIHGFGASSFHYAKSVRLLKERYHVFAMDCIGFGRSDKPPMQYTVAVWEAMVWDFIRDVVGKPVYVAGNSIGGIFASAFGTDAYPILSAGICLINTAGPMADEPAQVEPAQSAVAAATPSSLPSPSPSSSPSSSPSRSRGLTGLRYFLKWRWIRMLVGRFILRSLRGRVARTLNIVYPTRALDSDSKLPEEILRASFDYSAANVISSGIVSPKARSFEKILGRYRGPLLIFNGIKDPLGNVRLRTTQLKDLYPAATVVTIDAGHCPHDEMPEEFVEALTTWVENSEANKKAGAKPQTDQSEVAKVDAR